MTDTKLKDLLARWSVLSGLDLTASIRRDPGGGALLTIEDRCSPAAYDMACFELQRPERSGAWVAVPIDEETGRPDRNCLVSAHRYPGLAELFWPDGSADYRTIVEAMKANNERERAEDMSSGLEQHLWGELEKARNERDEALARMIAAEEQLRQAKAEKLQAVKVLVGVGAPDGAFPFDEGYRQDAIECGPWLVRVWPTSQAGQLYLQIDSAKRGSPPLGAPDCVALLDDNFYPGAVEVVDARRVRLGCRITVGTRIFNLRILGGCYYRIDTVLSCRAAPDPRAMS